MHPSSLVNQNIVDSVSLAPATSTMSSMAQPASGISTLNNGGRGTRGGRARGQRGRARGNSTHPLQQQGGQALGMSVSGQAAPIRNSSGHTNSLPQTSIQPTPAPRSPVAALSVRSSDVTERGLNPAMQSTVSTASATARAGTPTLGRNEMHAALSQGTPNDSNAVDG